ncbi:hypothetical protein G6F54_014388 [Rhizopus delemar]|nr:hypothetical protein G6F54_014388 [Rhizopus delemar]
MPSSATPRACAWTAAATRWCRTCRRTASTPSPSTRRAWPTTSNWKAPASRSRRSPVPSATCASTPAWAMHW